MPVSKTSVAVAWSSNVGRLPMDGVALLGHHLALAVDGLAEDVEHAAQRLVAPRAR